MVPGGSDYNGVGSPYTPSASSRAVSTVGNKLIVAGANGNGLNEGAVCAYDATDAKSLWCNTTPIDVVTSSPVVSDSIGAVFVQSTGTCGLGGGAPLIYALDVGSGVVAGGAAPFLPPPPPVAGNMKNQCCPAISRTG